MDAKDTPVLMIQKKFIVLFSLEIFFETIQKELERKFKIILFFKVFSLNEENQPME